MSARVLNNLMRRAVARKESPEVVYEIARSAAQFAEREMMLTEHPEPFTQAWVQLTQATDSASRLVMLFCGHGARKAWLEYRRKQPWYKRMWLPMEPSERFVQAWSVAERTRGQKLVVEALREEW